MNYIKYNYHAFRKRLKMIYNGLYKYPAYLKQKVKINYSSIVENCQFEGYNSIDENTILIDSRIGLGSYLSGNCNLSKANIGRFCSIGQNVQNRFSLHPSRDFVSTHPAFYSTKKQAGITFVNKNKFDENKFADEDKKYFLIIGNDVWIGSNVQIMKGIKINDGVIIASGSVVTKDLNAYGIYGGVPAKLIRYRFNQIFIEQLLQIRWWEHDLQKLHETANNFDNIEKYLNNN